MPTTAHTVDWRFSFFCRRLTRLDPFAARQFQHQRLVERGLRGKVEAIQAFGLGKVRLPATSSEAVSTRAASAARAHLAAGVPVGAYLADQLLLPMALARGGHFVTVAPTPHTLSNIEVIGVFLGKPLTVARQANATWKVEA